MKHLLTFFALVFALCGKLSAADIARVRQEVTDRKTPWTHEELLILSKQKPRK